MKQKTTGRRDYVKMTPKVMSSYNVKPAPYYCDPMRNDYSNKSAASNLTGGPRDYDADERGGKNDYDRDDYLNRRY